VLVARSVRVVKELRGNIAAIVFGAGFAECQAAARAVTSPRGDRSMSRDKLRYAQHLMADRSRSIPAVCRELGDIPSSTLYHYLHADGSLKEPGRMLLDR
jgi:hypothetical protein